MKQIYVLFTFFILNNIQVNAQFTDLITGLSCPCGLTFKDNDLYFSESGAGKVSKINLIGNNPTPVIVISGLKGPSSLSFKNNELYIGESSGDKISKINISETTPILKTVISGLDWPYSIAIKDNELYFTEFLGKLSKINISETSPIPTTIKNLSWQNKLAFNGNDLYIAQFTIGKISKMNITDSAPTIQSVENINYPNGITIANNNLFVSHLYETKVSIKNLINNETKTVMEGLTSPSDLGIKDNILYMVQANNKISKIDLSLLSVDNYNLNNTIKLFPNPAEDFIQVSNLTKTTDYIINNSVGEKVLVGAISKDGFINIKNLIPGLYFLKIKNNKSTLKFIKK